MRGPLVNRDLALLRAAFNWAIGNGLLKSSPFRVENVPIMQAFEKRVGRTVDPIVYIAFAS